MPRIPEQIIVTFEGQTREVLRIGRVEEERGGRPGMGARRGRYYKREEMD